MSHFTITLRYLFLLSVLLFPLACSESNPTQAEEEEDPPIVNPPPTNPPRLSSITLTTDQTVLPSGGATIFVKATGFDQHGARITADTLQYVWASTEPARATVSNGMVTTGDSFGPATLTATIGDIEGKLAVDVWPTSGHGLPLVDMQIIATLDRWNIPGAAYAMVKNGRLVMARGYGFADLGTEEPVAPDALFRIASISKPFTAVAVLKLIEEGKLSLTDKAFDILSDFVPTGGPADPRILDITVAQLLHHTGGWDRSIVGDIMFQQRQIAQAMGVASPPDADTIVRYLHTQPLQFTPGTQFVYANLSYLVLGRIMERVTGEAYEPYMLNNVLGPMGITRARIGRAKLSERLPDEVRYYPSGSPTTGLSVFDDEPGSVLLPYGGFGALQPMDAHGGWVASAIDLARFGIAVDGDPATAEFLTDASFDYMVSNPGSGYGAGWFLNSTDHNHSGGLIGTASVLWIRNDGTIFAAVLNKTNGGTFYNDFIGGFIQAVDGIFSEAWTSEDLFAQYE